MNKELGEAHAKDIGGVSVHVDVTDPASVSQGLVEAAKHVGDLRVVVNCAEMGRAAKTVSRGKAHDPVLFETVIKANLLGSFTVASQAAA